MTETEALEAKLSFPSLNRQDLFKIGSALAEKALAESLPIVIDIRLGEVCVYRFAAEDTSANTQTWVKRKQRAVAYFGHSTLWLNEKVKGDESLLESKYALDPKTVTCVPGGFPLILKGTGPVGTLCVGGLKPEEDHRLVTEALAKHLGISL